jgi:DNA-binding winged helix-turn-helix (wHTH) protein
MSTELTGMQTLVGRSFVPEVVAEGPRFLSFGSFTVDLKREELFKDGARVKLPGKVYQTLVALLARPGEVVSREDLRMKLWPEGTHVNYDANVNTTVNKLRLALGDSPDAPIYVETIPRQGYSFVGKVSPGVPSGVSRLEIAGGLSEREEQARVAMPIAAVSAEPVTVPVSKWFVAGMVALVLAGMLFGATAVMYLHR